MRKDPKVIKIHFRVSDKFHGHQWKLNDDCTFAEDIPELHIAKGDKALDIEGQDCRGQRKLEVLRLLTLKKFTQFTSITIGKKDHLSSGQIVFSNEVKLLFF